MPFYRHLALLKIDNYKLKHYHYKRVTFVLTFELLETQKITIKHYICDQNQHSIQQPTYLYT